MKNNMKNIRIAKNTIMAKREKKAPPGDHVACERAFDGPRGDIAHSWATGDIHFDSDENFQETVDLGDESQVHLLKVAVHEVGHVLGLSHIEYEDSVMYPIYRHPTNNAQLELSETDRSAMKGLYGHCTGTFDAVFDFIYWSLTEKQFHYNTYFFRGEKMWLFMSSLNRTRLGDPVSIASKNNNLFLHNETDNDVAEGWPKKLTDIFHTENEPISIPTPIDAAYFSDAGSLFFMFKGPYFWMCKWIHGAESHPCKNRMEIRQYFTTLVTDEYPDTHLNF
ncbi:hypothetical protein HELRODRAFT_169917 [Helobdella robusta]|uniref:Peptidase metallopeptidase domain-containing protein n=1 Tax=Helobdella robusta TaxID=6412 RepID=T1F2G0_HELRO|nr:hypothetical protein HELRODRAFT_169917 [Helobdella robusta]ESO08179.1 hypothetical protein HELRODRAFT_169917 [Helobdella robusta]